MKKIFFVLVLVLSSTCLLFAANPKSPFIFAISDFDGETLVYINTVKEWEENRRLTDGYSEEESEALEPILDAAKLINSMESVYEPAKKITKKQLKKKLEKLGLGFDPAFQFFIDRENGQSIEIAGDEIEGHTTLYKLLSELFYEFGVAVDLLGEPRLPRDIKTRIRMVVEHFYIADDDYATLLKLAKSGRLSDYKNPLFKGKISEMMDDRSVLPKNFVRELIEVLDPKKKKKKCDDLL